MSSLKLSHPTKIIEGVFTLPASKSISNRLLILRALSGGLISIGNLSEADDTQILRSALEHTSGTIDIKNAGTCMRFLTAWFASRESDIVLHGNDRMHKRPIAGLVESLRQLGADITYLAEEGFPPLKIRGKMLRGGVIHAAKMPSSQFITALMLVAPQLEGGLTIHLDEDIPSASYIHMTLRLMQACGLTADLRNGTIHIPAQAFASCHMKVEPDWSAASYWYALAALSRSCHISLPGLFVSPLQGDSVIATYMESCGVSTVYTPQGVTLTKNDKLPEHTVYRMRETPDLVPAMAVTLAALNRSEAVFQQVSSLRIKESDRLGALQAALSECGFNITSAPDTLNIAPAGLISPPPSGFATYGDHRMAMSFACLALVFEEIRLHDPEVVEKSYPHFWEDLQKAGFVVRKFGNALR